MAESERTARAGQRKRAPRGQRRKLIIDGALKVFAEKGFSAGTREIAAALGVTQALIYRYFDSKDALIDAVFEERYAKGEFMPDPAALGDPAIDLDERVIAFYCAMLDSLQDDSLRLYLHAALAGYAAPAIYAPVILEGSVKPLIAALRDDRGLPGLDARGLSRAEYDLAMAQHGNVVFTAIRHSIYKVARQLPIEEAVAQLSRVWLRGARVEIEAIHAAWARQSPVNRPAGRAPG